MKTRKLSATTIRRVCDWYSVPFDLIDRFVEVFTRPNEGESRKLLKEVGVVYVGVGNTLSNLRDARSSIEKCLSRPTPVEQDLAFYRSQLSFVMRRVPGGEKYIDQAFDLWRTRYSREPIKDKRIRERFIESWGPERASVLREGYRHWLQEADQRIENVHFTDLLMTIIVSLMPA